MSQKYREMFHSDDHQEKKKLFLNDSVSYVISTVYTLHRGQNNVINYFGSLSKGHDPFEMIFNPPQIYVLDNTPFARFLCLFSLSFCL